MRNAARQPRLRHHLRLGAGRRGQPGLRRRLDRARDDAAALHPADPRAAQPAARSSSSRRRPQIRYPDCYGIDMSEIGKFVAFEAVVDLLKESGRARILDEVYQRVPWRRSPAPRAAINHVRRLYEPFTAGGDFGPDRRSSSGRPGSTGTARSRSSSRRSRTCTPPCPRTRATGISRGNTRRRAATAW